MALGLGDLSERPGFSTEELQIENKNQLNAILAKAFLQKTTDDWMTELESKGVLCARINSFEGAARDPQIACNNMIVSMEDPEVGELKLLGTPMRLKGTPPKLKSFPPRLGEHSHDVAIEIGYSEEEVARMKDEGIFG